jgi:hypothetical protein
LAPDLPGFGFSELRDRAEFVYTFDNLAKAMQLHRRAGPQA